MDISALKVVELQSELKSRGLDTKGKKAELQRRLQASIDSEQSEITATVPTAEVCNAEEHNLADNPNNEEAAGEVVSAGKKVEKGAQSKGESIAEEKTSQEPAVIAAVVTVPAEETSTAPSNDNSSSSTITALSMEKSEADSDLPQSSSSSCLAEDVAYNKPEQASEAAKALVKDANVQAIEGVTAVKSPKEGEKEKEGSHHAKPAEETREKEKEKEKEDKEELEEEEGSSPHVRIDNFQRPLNSKGLSEWLSTQLGVEVPREKVWLHSLRTHCYLSLPSAKLAAKAKRVLTGQIFSQSKVPLVVTYTQVSVEDAATAPEAQTLPANWTKGKDETRTIPPPPHEIRKTVSAPSIVAVALSDLKNPLTAKASLVPEASASSSMKPLLASAAIFKKSISQTMRGSAGAASNIAPLRSLSGSLEEGFTTSRRRNSLDAPPSSVPVTVSIPVEEKTGADEGNSGGSMLGKRRVTLEEAGEANNSQKKITITATNSTDRRESRKAEVEESGANDTAQVPPEKRKEEASNSVDIDSHFRKTTCTPHIYWLPVSADVIAKRRSAISAVPPAK